MKTLLLDLDETLVHCVHCIDSSQCLNSVHDFEIVISPGNAPRQMSISLRPGLQLFLEAISKIFEVIVFTASERNYAERVIKIIDPKGFIDGILARENCLEVEKDEFVKDLRCLERDERNILIVDNALAAVMQLDALIPIVPFYGNEEDRQLKEIMPYLLELSQADDMINRNREMFQWQAFEKAQSFQEYINAIRRNKLKQKEEK